jgi:DNA polymerase-3 subunit epsilon
MNFVAIDVETANPDFSSICQVGVASFRDGKLHELWESLVNPEDYFDDMNIAVHGIDDEMVRKAPKWPAVYEQLANWLSNNVVASHTTFDREALIRACAKNGMKPYESTWLNTARVVRRAWPEFSQKATVFPILRSTVALNFSTTTRRKMPARQAKFYYAQY